jgi:hypothetical protein
MGRGEGKKGREAWDGIGMGWDKVKGECAQQKTFFFQFITNGVLFFYFIRTSLFSLKHRQTTHAFPLVRSQPPSSHLTHPLLTICCYWQKKVRLISEH